MTEPATEKQISYATSLGILSPATYDKVTLKNMISAKLGNPEQAATKQEVKESFPTVKPGQPTEERKQILIIRQCSIKAAALAALAVTGDSDAVIKAAQDFENWILRS